MKTQTPPKMAMNLLVLLSVTAIVQRTEATCSFPSALTGAWHSSRWGDVTFTSTQLSVTGLVDIGSIVFECELNSGSIYVLRSMSTVTVLGNTVDVVTCLDITQVSSVNFMYYHATTEVAFSVGTEPVKLVSPSSSITTSIVCTVSTPYHTGTNHMLILSGSELSAAQQCPDVLLGTFNNYTVDKGSGAQCGGVGYFSVCDNHKNVTVDYGICSEVLFYSSGGVLECVYSSSNGSTYFVDLYNFDSTVDDSTTYRFTCLAVEAGTGTDESVYATQYPRACSDIQTATSVPSTGGVIQMVANVPSSSSTSSSSILLLIVVVVVLLLLIVLAALAVYHLWYRKRWPAVKEKLSCGKGRSKGQVDPQMDNEDVRSSQAPADASERPLSGQKPTMVTTAVVTNDSVKRLQSSQSSRSIVTPSKLQPEMSEGESAAPDSAAADSLTSSAAQDHTTPRRLPPLETIRTGEAQRSLEPVYLSQQRMAPLDSSRLSEESESSDAVSIAPRLPPIHESEPLYQNM